MSRLETVSRPTNVSSRPRLAQIGERLGLGLGLEGLVHISVNNCLDIQLELILVKELGNYSCYRMKYLFQCVNTAEFLNAF
jgi:hypothetical protein